MKDRPSEYTAGLVIAASIYGFLAESGLANALAVVIAVVLALVPLAVSNVIDSLRGN